MVRDVFSTGVILSVQDYHAKVKLLVVPCSPPLDGSEATIETAR